MNLFAQEFSPPVSAADAVSIQRELATRVSLKNAFSKPRLIAGVDVSYDIESNLTKAFIALVDYETLSLIDCISAVRPTDFPYVPGLLSFREIPTIFEALKKLDHVPDMLMVDGQGVAHPRRLGIAAHLGVLTNLPAIGVAKSRLTGRFTALGDRRGDMSLLMDKAERIGTVLRSKEKCNPLFVSPGHRVDHETALAITMHCLTRYRLPEPTRLADKFSKEKDAEKEKAAGMRRLL
ncbi:MAG: deoxyribonuclease V [Pseudomonadota bacterium]